MGVIRSCDLWCSLEEEKMVEELSGVTHARHIKVRWDEDKIQTNTVVLIFDGPKPPSRIYAGYLTLDDNFDISLTEQKKEDTSEVAIMLFILTVLESGLIGVTARRSSTVICVIVEKNQLD
ncbi:Gag-like protein [Plakobranchus ocellatus]|uniref:Gag-like protein n=1 Tax=Plakobranchus ocellatus TaxID=259542 RepID=A0AAV4BX29_9GAST|nr:Gag-like protein [Plakobranchus ocellatus]